jgi:hypothetical protein
MTGERGISSMTRLRHVPALAALAALVVAGAMTVVPGTSGRTLAAEEPGGLAVTATDPAGTRLGGA